MASKRNNRGAQERAARAAAAKRAAEAKRLRLLKLQRQKREAEARKQREAEARKRREADIRKKREADARKKREADIRKKREAEARKKREADIRKKREAEARSKREADIRKKREADIRKKREAEALKKREADIRKKREAEARKQREADIRKQREAEARKRREADIRKQREAEARKRSEAAARAKTVAESRRRQAAEAAKKKAAQEQARNKPVVKKSTLAKPTNNKKPTNNNRQVPIKKVTQPVSAVKNPSRGANKGGSKIVSAKQKVQQVKKKPTNNNRQVPIKKVTQPVSTVKNPNRVPIKKVTQPVSAVKNPNSVANKGGSNIVSAKQKVQQVKKKPHTPVDKLLNRVINKTDTGRSIDKKEAMTIAKKAGVSGNKLNKYISKNDIKTTKGVTNFMQGRPKGGQPKADVGTRINRAIKRTDIGKRLLKKEAQEVANRAGVSGNQLNKYLKQDGKDIKTGKGVTDFLSKQGKQKFGTTANLRIDRAITRADVGKRLLKNEAQEVANRAGVSGNQLNKYLKQDGKDIKTGKGVTDFLSEQGKQKFDTTANQRIERTMKRNDYGKKVGAREAAQIGAKSNVNGNQLQKYFNKKDTKTAPNTEKFLNEYGRKNFGKDIGTGKGFRDWTKENNFYTPDNGDGNKNIGGKNDLGAGSNNVGGSKVGNGKVGGNNNNNNLGAGSNNVGDVNNNGGFNDEHRNWIPGPGPSWDTWNSGGGDSGWDTWNSGSDDSGWDTWNSGGDDWGSDSWNYGDDDYDTYDETFDDYVPEDFNFGEEEEEETEEQTGYIGGGGVGLTRFDPFGAMSGLVASNNNRFGGKAQATGMFNNSSDFRSIQRPGNYLK